MRSCIAMRGFIGLVIIGLGAAPVQARSSSEAVTLERSGDTRTDGADAATPSVATPLDLATVLRATTEQFPPLVAAREERAVRDGQQTSARGRFDTRVIGSGDLRPAGFYENYAGAAAVEQQTTWYGARLFGGYRAGRGRFPSYEGDRLTDDDGEVRGGLVLPLLRGGPIDEARAAVQVAQIGRRRAEPEIALQRIDALRDAKIAYWNWVAAGQRVKVAEQLLDVAESRQDQIEGRVKRGAEPEIDLVDNQRMIVDRQLRLRGVERDFEQAAIELSLYLRDEAGRPVVAPRPRVPNTFPTEVPPDAERFGRELETARTAHPALRAMSLDRDRLEVELRHAKNDALPAMDLQVVGSQDFGRAAPGIDTNGRLSAAPRSQAEMRALVRLELPVQRREARGRAAATRARLTQLDRRQHFMRERIVANVRQAIEGIEAAYEQTGQARENLRLAETLRRAEQRRLTLGRSNLIDVNIRELQAATAAEALIDAQAAYFRTLAAYEAAAAVPTLDGLGDPSI